MPEFTPLLLLGVALAGGLGAAARYVTDTLLRERREWTAPAATFLINATGSFLLGLFTGLVTDGTWHALLGAGFCGGFTTFSTAMLDAVRLWREQRRGRAAVFLFGQFIVCAVFAVAGALLFVTPPSA